MLVFPVWVSRWKKSLCNVCICHCIFSVLFWISVCSRYCIRLEFTLNRREEYLPYPSHIKQLNSHWKENLNNLRNIVQACNESIVKREELFKRITSIDLVESTGEVKYTKLIFNSMFMTRKKFDEHMEIPKGVIGWEI